MSGRLAGTLALALAAGAAALFALDRGLALVTDGYRPTRGVPNRDRRLERPEFAVRVVTNALGFREPRLPAAKPPGTVRIVVVGDSFTQGYGVEEDEAYPRRLEAALDARAPECLHEVVNLGVPGSNPRDYVGNLRDPGLAYAPDVVIVGVMANDVHEVWIQEQFGVRFASDLVGEVRRAARDPTPSWKAAAHRLWPTLYRVGSARLEALQQSALAGPATPPEPRATASTDGWRDVLLALAARFDRRAAVESALATMSAAKAAGLARVVMGVVPLDSSEAAAPYSDLMALLQPRAPADLVLLPPRYDDAWRRTAAHLRTLAGLARDAGARPVLVFVPAAHQVTAAARPELEAHGYVWDDRTLGDTTLSNRVQAVADEERITFVDLLTPLRAARDDSLYFPDDGHWTPRGHTLAALHIAEALGVLPCDDTPERDPTMARAPAS